MYTFSPACSHARAPPFSNLNPARNGCARLRSPRHRPRPPRMSDFFAQDFFRMGGYGAYVWSAYAVFAIVLLVDAFTPFWQRRSTLRTLAARLRRDAARKTPSASPYSGNAS